MSWNRPSPNTVDATSSSRSAGRGKMPRLRSGLLAGLVVVALGALGLYLFSSGEAMSSSLQKKDRGRIKEVTPAAAPTNMVEKVATNNAQRASQVRKAGTLPPKIYVPTPEEIAKARLGPDGKPRKKSPYKSALEQALGQIFTTVPGSSPPRFGGIPHLVTEQQLKKFLDTPMIYDKNDSKALQENRMLMQQVKDELANYLKEGGRAEDFVDHYYQELVTANEQWKTAQHMLVQMHKDGESHEAIAEFYDNVSKLFSSRGIKNPPMPAWLKEERKAVNAPGVGDQSN